MKLSLTTPFPVDSLQGNSVSSRRIAKLLENAGHDVEIFQNGFSRDTDCLIALNAWRSAETISKFATQCPHKKLIVVMTGSDLFPLDGIIKPETLQSIKSADAIVITHAEGREKIDHPAVYEIRKSIKLPASFIHANYSKSDRKKFYEGLIVSHLRAQKNPFLYLRAVPYIKNPIRVKHYGNASGEYQENAEKYRSESYQWMSEVPQMELLNALNNADFLLNTSYIEGSANAIYESIALGTPIIASAIPGNIGVLGKEYPGLFRTDDSQHLARILDQFSTSSDFREELKQRCHELSKEIGAQREQQDWGRLIEEIGQI